MTMPALSDPTNYGNTPGNGPLRPNGKALSALPSGDEDLPSTESHAVKSQKRALAIVRDLWSGNGTLQEKSTDYLPRAAGESPANYATRLSRAVFHNFLRNTIQGLVGFMFREDPKLGDDVPDPIKRDAENIDNQNTHIDVFLREVETDAMTAGHAAIFVEFPKTGGQQSAAVDGGAGGTAVANPTARPYWIHIRKDDMVSWRTETQDGKQILRQLVLRECQYVPAGMFGEKKQTRYRVLYNEDGMVGFRLLEISENRIVMVVDEGLYPTQDEIPIAEIRTSGRLGLFESEPPFIDLAYLNLAHYRQWSDQDTSIHKTCVPIYWEAGADIPVGSDGTPQPDLVLGPSTARISSNPAFKTGYTSHDGASLGSCKASLDDLKNDMAALGLAALASQKRAAETAQAKEIDKGATDSALAVNARGCQDGGERALYFHARYYKLPSGGSIEINRNYGKMQMDAATMAAWGALARDLGVPVLFVLERLMEGGQIPEGTDLDDVANQAMAALAEKEARKAQDAADRLQQTQDMAA